MNQIIPLPNAFQRQIKNLCLKIEDELKRASHHSIEVCKLLVQLRSEFETASIQVNQDGKKVSVREYYFDFVEQVFGLKKSVIYDYLKVGETPHLWKLGVTISKLHLLASIEPERAQKFIKKNRAQINKSSYRELKTIVHQIKLAPTKSVTLPTPAKQPIAELSFSPEVANHEVENCVEDIRENFARLKNVLKQKPIPKELLHLLKDIHQWSKSHVSKN